MSFTAIILIAVVLVLGVPGSASAGDRWQAVCHSGFDPNFDTCILTFANAVSTKKVRAGGGELIRAFISNAVRIESPILIVEAVLPKSGDGSLTVRDPIRKNVSRSYRLSRLQFETLKKQVRVLRFAGAVLHGGTPKPEPAPENRVCLDAASARVDAILDGKVATTDLNYCNDEDAAFLDKFLALTLSVSGQSGCVKRTRVWAADGIRQCLHEGAP